MRFTRYLSGMLLRRALAAALILAFIMQVLDLVDNAGDIIDQGDGLPGLLRYAGLKMPSLMTRALPLGALIGTLLTLLTLARNSEIAAMRSAGRSTGNMFLMMLPGAVLLTLMQSTLIDVVVPRTEARLAIIATRAADDTATDDGKEVKPTWIRVGDAIISFDRVGARGRRLRTVKIYDRDASKLVTARTTAGEARWDKGRWVLSDAERITWTRENFNVRTPADGPWATTLTPDDVLSALTPESRVSLTAARAVLAGQATPNAPIAFYQTLVERVYSGPLGTIVMVLLSMPAALVNWRNPRSARYAVVALTGGLIFMLCDGLLSTLALTGVITPVVGAWSAVVLFMAYGLLRLRSIDSRFPAPKAGESRLTGA